MVNPDFLGTLIPMKALIYTFLTVFASIHLNAQEAPLSKITVTYNVNGEAFSAYANVDKNISYNLQKGEISIDVNCDGKGYQLVSLETENNSASSLMSEAQEYLLHLRSEVKVLMKKTDAGSRSYRTKGENPLVLTISWEKVGKNKYVLTETITLAPQLAQN